MSQARIWTGSADFTSGSSTPFGTYDSDNLFKSDAPKVASWCAKRLGYPIIDIEIIDVKIKDIQLPENMRRMMANQAEAERSRRARVILALAEEQAAGKLLEAGKLIDQSPSAIKLRLYQTLANIAAEKNSTIIFPFPEEALPRNTK